MLSRACRICFGDNFCGLSSIFRAAARNPSGAPSRICNRRATSRDLIEVRIGQQLAGQEFHFMKAPKE
jgi:hypothetical protein